MSTYNEDGIFSRISARSGQPVGLDVTFFRNGVPTDPFALRRIDIYFQAVKDENLKAQILFGTPDTTGYPAPAIQDSARPGFFSTVFEVPIDFEQGIYFDVWRFIGSEPEVSNGSVIDFDNEDLWHSQCNKFWVFPDGWFLDDGLITPRFAFEPQDRIFRKGEIRNLEVGVMPLPLYDFNQNRILPLMPQLCPFITISTENGEILAGLERAPCKIGLRQGTYRSNPYVIQCLLDTNNFLKGTYVYRISVDMPNGETRISDPFRFEII